jgi:hypothetical protein
VPFNFSFKQIVHVIQIPHLKYTVLSSRRWLVALVLFDVRMPGFLFPRGWST